MTSDRELGKLRLMRAMSAYLEDVREDDSALKFCLRATRDFFGATEACLAVASPGSDGSNLLHELPSGVAWDPALLTSFLRAEKPRIPFDTLAAPLRRKGRRWGAIFLRRGGSAFQRGEGWDLVEVAEHVTGLLDRERVQEVRARVDRKIMEQLRPRDLFYQILDALRALTHYDHSSALLIADGGGPALALAAEQLAWHKGRSRRIGMKLVPDQAAALALRAGGVHGFTRRGESWLPWSLGSDPALARLLDYNRPDHQPEDTPREMELLCAPIATKGGVIGVIKVASLRSESMGGFELGVLGQFTSHASVAIQYLQGTESLRTRMIDAERRNAIAEIARGVAHDVNNALGSVLPLVQQMQADAGAGTLDAAQATVDLGRIETGVQYCRRIFRGLTSFASGRHAKVGHANVRRAVDGTLAILKSSLDRGRVRSEAAIAENLPLVQGGQSDIERLIFNLASNAIDAMPGGGALRIGAAAVGDRVVLTVQDNGRGIPPGDFARIFEPGYTTKPDGSGLGLSVCRAIVWALGGDMKLESLEGRGTIVRVFLPLVDSGGGDE